MTINRRQKLLNVGLQQDGKTYFKQYTIVQQERADETKREGFTKWCGLSWH